MSMLGGFSDAKPADADTKALFETAEIQMGLKNLLGFDVTEFTVEAYKTQVVAGLNYTLHGTVNGSTKVEVHAFKALPHAGGESE